MTQTIHQLQTYTLRQLYDLEESKKSYRTFQRHKDDYVAVRVPIGKKSTTRYLSKADSATIRYLKTWTFGLK